MRTFIWFAYFWIYLLIAVPVSAYLWWLERQGRWEKADRLVKKWVRNWALRLMRLAGVTVQVQGKENLPKQPAVYVANHQGYFDIPVMLTCLEEPSALLAKKEIQRLPGIRTWMRHLHCLFIDRSSPRAGVQAIQDAQSLIEQGRSLTIFPEGTRAKDGKIQPFQAGAFRIAAHTGVPIVPITIEGTRSLMEGNRGWIRPGKVHVTIHPPIPTQEMSREGIRTLSQTVQSIVASALPNP